MVAKWNHIGIRPPFKRVHTKTLRRRRSDVPDSYKAEKVLDSSEKNGGPDANEVMVGDTQVERPRRSFHQKVEKVAKADDGLYGVFS